MSGGQYAFYYNLLLLSNMILLLISTNSASIFVWKIPLHAFVFMYTLACCCFWSLLVSSHYCLLHMQMAERPSYDNSLLDLGLEHTLLAHHWLKCIYDGFPSCLIRYYIFVHSPNDSSFDSLWAVHEGDLWVICISSGMQLIHTHCCRKSEMYLHL